MPFGLCNSPATFQRLMQTVLTSLEWKSCYVYIDNILVFSKTWEEHLDHLQQLFDRLRKAGLTHKPVKWSFLRESVPFLGHIISQQGIQPDPTKISKVKDIPMPTDVDKVQQFLCIIEDLSLDFPRLPTHHMLSQRKTFTFNGQPSAKKLLTT